jgi:hypothetical protein
LKKNVDSKSNHAAAHRDGTRSDARCTAWIGHGRWAGANGQRRVERAEKAEKAENNGKTEKGNGKGDATLIHPALFLKGKKVNAEKGTLPLFIPLFSWPSLGSVF